MASAPAEPRAPLAAPARRKEQSCTASLPQEPSARGLSPAAFLYVKNTRDSNWQNSKDSNELQKKNPTRSVQASPSSPPRQHQQLPPAATVSSSAGKPVFPFYRAVLPGAASHFSLLTKAGI